MGQQYQCLEEASLSYLEDSRALLTYLTLVRNNPVNIHIHIHIPCRHIQSHPYTVPAEI